MTLVLILLTQATRMAAHTTMHTTHRTHRLTERQWPPRDMGTPAMLYVVVIVMVHWCEIAMIAAVLHTWMQICNVSVTLATLETTARR